jgi:choline dehydrogenase-like flavoprotein
MTHTADVIVLGMGVGGDLLAEHIADAGLDVVGIEDALRDLRKRERS